MRATLAVLAALLITACPAGSQTDRGQASLPATCDDVARSVTELYVRVGLANGNKADVLAQIRVQCPDWTAGERACVVGSLERAQSPMPVEKCGVIRVDFVAPADH